VALFGHAGGMVVARRHQRDAVTQTDFLGSLRAGGEKYFRRREVGIFLQKMMLNIPGMFDTQPVRQFNLIQGLHEQPVFIAAVPGPGNLMLVKYAEFHD
jgi:hypothetical protein